MPEVKGRRRAVSVAIFVAAIVVSIIPTAATSTTAPPGINRFLYALGQVESGGNYYARNSSSGAYGKYQIMPSNWPGWAKLYVGSSTAPQTPVNQEKVARGKVTALYAWLDTWPNVAHWWLTGSGERNQALWSTYSKTYVAKIMGLYNSVSETTAALDVGAVPPPLPVGVVDVTSRRIQENNAGIAYVGRWATAGHRGYADGEVLYSERDGATATYYVLREERDVDRTGRVDPRQGPRLGRRRRHRRGRHAQLVVRAAGQPVQPVLATDRVAHHQIEVIGSGRPVAIDQFIITR